MEVVFADDDLDRLETDPVFDAGLSEGVVKAYRKRLQALRSAADERDLYAMKSFHFEKLKGKRQGQHSIRLNDQFRLVIELQSTASSKIVRVLAIEDYH